jgi:hypothetical protein
VALRIFCIASFSPELCDSRHRSFTCCSWATCRLQSRRSRRTALISTYPVTGTCKKPALPSGWKRWVEFALSGSSPPDSEIIPKHCHLFPVVISSSYLFCLCAGECLFRPTPMAGRSSAFGKFQFCRIVCSQRNRREPDRAFRFMQIYNVGRSAPHEKEIRSRVYARAKACRGSKATQERGEGTALRQGPAGAVTKSPASRGDRTYQ